MIENLNRIESKIDKIVDDISAIKVIAAEQGVELKAHTRRSTALERLVMAVMKRIVPLEQRHERINGIFKLIGFLTVIAGLVEVMLKVMKFVRSI